MDFDEYLDAMIANTGDVDEEAAHADADRLLCQLIREHLPQFGAVVDAWERVPKWYA